MQDGEIFRIEDNHGCAGGGKQAGSGRGIDDMARNARDVRSMLPGFAENMDIPAVFRCGSEAPSPGIKDRPLVIRPRILCVFNSRKTEDLR